MTGQSVTLLLACAALAVQAAEIKATDLSLSKIRRIYVGSLGGGKEAIQMRDMIIAALQNAGLFTITENPERADAALKGSGDETTFTERHITSDSIGFRAGDSSGSREASSIGTSTSSSKSISAGITENESSNVQERRHEASASVRLVTNDGDVVWSTTQESNGAKFRSAMADVADKIAHRLIEETQRARTLAAAVQSVSPQASVVP